MSTRAIIGIQNKNGTISGAWQWNDGKGLLYILNRYFNTKDKAERLIVEGVWCSMWSPRNTREVRDIISRVTPKDRCYVVELEKCHIIKDRTHDIRRFEDSRNDGVKVKGTYLMFKNKESAIAQDINYLYLFSPEDNKWRVYK